MPIVKDEDVYVFAEDYSEHACCWSANDLREIADEVDRLNNKNVVEDDYWADQKKRNKLLTYSLFINTAASLIMSFIDNTYGIIAASVLLFVGIGLFLKGLGPWKW